MKSRLLLFLIVSLFYSPPHITAQRNILSKVDSLQAYLKTNPSDTSKINALNLLAKQYVGTGDFDKAVVFAQQAKTLSEKTDFQKGLANAINTIGVIQMNLGNYDKAMASFKSALTIREKIDDKIGVAASYSNIGLIYYDTGDRAKALEYYRIALKKRMNIGDKQGIATSFNNIGNLFIAEGNYDSTIVYYQKALDLYRIINDKLGMAMSYNNIGIVFSDQGNYPKALGEHLKSLAIKEELGDKVGMGMSFNNIGLIYYKLDNFKEALSYHIKSLSINQEIGNKSGIALSYNNIAIIYDREHNTEKALENNLKAMEIREEIGDMQGSAMSYSNIGLIYVTLGKLDQALSYQLKAMNMNEKIEDNIGLTISYINVASIYMKQAENGNKSKLIPASEYIQKSFDLSNKINYKDGIMNAYLSFSKLNDVRGDYKEAFRYHKLYSIAKDSLFSEESAKQMAEMNARFETAKKDKEIIKKDADIKEQQARARQQVILRNTFIIGFIIVLILALFIFRSYKQKQKANTIITEQKNEVENQKLLVESKNKEITDSINYAKRIQDAMLPSRKVFNDLLIENFVFYQPKDIISGDFYWTTQKENKLFIAVADCTGHGVPGALMSMIGITFLRQIINEMKITDTAMILNKLHEMVLAVLNEDVNVKRSVDGMDIGLLQIDISTRQIEFSGAIRPLYLVNKNGLEIIKGDRFSIAGEKTPNESFSKTIVNPEPGTFFYIFSDGFADQFGGNAGKKFMIKNLQNYFLEIYKHPVSQQGSLLSKIFNEWKGTHEQVDDILVIGARI